ncbi:MAG: nucleotidyltransferase domain-containing protein [Saprospiraceae bacterium]|nr:nucleotidyltransferase domain-containing protein [Saprospiraceae bacterium]
MVTQTIALNIANAYLKELQMIGINVEKAVLFGSFAKNQQNEWSDIDLALFAKDFIGLTVIDKERFRRVHILPKYMTIEAHTFPLSIWDENDPFVEEIKRTGLIINNTNTPSEPA